MTISKALGNRIRDRREKEGLTQSMFAHEIGRSVDGLSLIERGKNWPSLDTVEKIANFFNIPATDLFDGLEVSGDVKSKGTHMARARATLSRLPEDRITLAAELLETLERNFEDDV